MKMKLLGACAIAGVLSLAATVSQAANRFTLGTNPQGTIYYTIGGGLAASLQDKLGKQVTVQPFTGSSVYLPMISAGEVTMGLNSSLDLGGWYRGEEGAKLGNLRVLARLWPLTVAYTTRANLGIKDIADLKGKRVVTDFTGLKAMSKLNHVMLELSGVPMDQITPITTAGLGPGVEGLTEGTVDATAVAVGIPLTQQAQATIPGGIRYLSIAGGLEASGKADQLFPGLYVAEVKPSKRLPEVTEPVYVAGFDVFLSVSADLSDEDAKAILSALHDGMPQLKKDYPALGGAGVEKLALPSNTVPYHPAAVAFFKEKGLWSQANETREASFAK